MHTPELTLHPVRSVLLTGATGFVGRFLLAQLLQDSRATVYCLVRAQSDYQAAIRIKASLLEWDLWYHGYERRIRAIPGDLRQPHLGMSEDDYRVVVQQIDSIYHCGASVNHLETYEMAKAANVTATQELLKIATQEKLKPIHHISTLGIFTDHQRAGTRVVSEDTPIEQERHRQSTGYIASKWVAENLILKARDMGVPSTIFRLGLLWADSRHGRFDDLQHVYRLIKSCLLARCGIEDYRFRQDPIPVDFATRAIVALSDKFHGKHSIFHLASSVQAHEGLFEKCNKVLHAPLTLLPYYDWIAQVKRLHQTGHSLPIVPLIDFAFSMDRHNFAQYLRLNELCHVRSNCEKTYRELAELGIHAPPLCQDLLRVCLERMVSRDIDLSEFRGLRGSSGSSVASLGEFAHRWLTSTPARAGRLHDSSVER